MRISTALNATAPEARRCEICVNGAQLVADLDGILWWPARASLVVADLHLEKGSAQARNRQILPPYDSIETLRRLARAIDDFRPRRVICLGDSFHDGEAPTRLPTMARNLLGALAEGREWLWITGNHDPSPPQLGFGHCLDSLVDGPLVFRHQAQPGALGEVSGHYHPKASVKVRLGSITGRCFVADDRRVILPAFGAYTGGLNVTDPAIAGLMARGYSVRLMGRDRLFTIPSSGLIAVRSATDR